MDATLGPAALAWLSAGVASAAWPGWFLEVAALGALAGFGGLARSWTRS